MIKAARAHFFKADVIYSITEYNDKNKEVYNERINKIKNSLLKHLLHMLDVSHEPYRPRNPTVVKNHSKLLAFEISLIARELKHECKNHGWKFKKNTKTDNQLKSTNYSTKIYDENLDKCKKPAAVIINRCAKAFIKATFISDMLQTIQSSPKPFMFSKNILNMKNLMELIKVAIKSIHNDIDDIIYMNELSTILKVRFKPLDDKKTRCITFSKVKFAMERALERDFS